MPSFLSIIASPVADFVSKVGGTIKQFVTTDKERLEAERALVELQASLQAKLMEADTQFAGMQRDAIVAEANGHSWLQRNWRPVVMLWLMVVLSYIVWTGGTINGREIDPSFVLRIFDIIELGLGGYVIGRSVEKTAPVVTKAITAIFKK